MTCLNCLSVSFSNTLASCLSIPLFHSAAIPVHSQRSELYRILVCVSILLCTILGLTYIMSKVKLQSHPQHPCLPQLQPQSPPQLLPRQPIPRKSSPLHTFSLAGVILEYNGVQITGCYIKYLSTQSA